MTEIYNAIALLQFIGIAWLFAAAAIQDCRTNGGIHAHRKVLQ